MNLKGEIMRVLSCVAVVAIVMTGCATTEKLMTKMGSEKTPFAYVLDAQPELKKEQQNISIRQVFNRMEAPSVAQITVLQTGLLDDSVAAIRNEYVFKREDLGKWQLQSREQSYKCMRGKNIINFQTDLCH